MFNTFRLDPVSEQSKNPFKVSGASSRTGRSTSLSSAPTEARLRHRWVFLTYSQCSIESKDEFEKWFSYMLEQKDLKTATYYGCRENHETEGIHYHVLVNLGKQPNWGSEHARSVFLAEGNECRSFKSTPWLRPTQSLSQFIEKCLSYCEMEKGGDCFGERPELSTKKRLERSRKWEEILFQPTAPAKSAMLKAEFPAVFYKLAPKTNDVE